MPYLKYDKSDLKFREECLADLIKDDDGKSLMSIINDPKHGIVIFLSDNLYNKLTEDSKLKYEIIPRNDITAPYFIALRKRYPRRGL